MLTSLDLLDDPIGLFPLLSGGGTIFIHNPRAMASSTLKVVWIKLLRLWNGMPMRRLANLDYRLWRTISIWSCSLGRSTILTTFALQQLTKEEMDLSDLCLVAFNSHMDISISTLEANWVRNSWARFSQERSLEGSTEANHLCDAPLSDMEKRAINCASSNPYALMTMLRVLGGYLDNQLHYNTQCLACETWWVS